MTTPGHLRVLPSIACPNAADHTPLPSGYLERDEWMERMHKTHRQIKCEGCGLYAIWIKRETPLVG